MIWRFVNLMVQDYATGAGSLHRLDVAKHLFYPSTARAEAAAASTKSKEKGSNNGGNKLPRIGSRLLRRLPPPTMCLQGFPATDHRYVMRVETFALLGADSHGGSDGRILHAGEGGRVLMYDADSGSTVTLPNLGQPKGITNRHAEPIFISIAGAGAGAGEEKKESLYVITDRDEWRHSFEVLDLSQQQPPHKWEWEHVPPPPFVKTTSSSSVKSFAVVDGGRTICVSTKRKGTLCFDTRSREWRRAGAWTLPFDGRVSYVPELRTWLGTRLPVRQRYSYSDDDYLCASSDLSAVSAGGDAAPTLQHVWRDVNPARVDERIELKGRLRGIVLNRTMEWVLRGRHLIKLGGGRFCVAKHFVVERVVRWGFQDDTKIEAQFVELTGVEVVAGGGGGGGDLRLVKHKSRHYRFATDVITWVL